jgi:hypothetical protein
MIIKLHSALTDCRGVYKNKLNKQVDIYEIWGYFSQYQLYLFVKIGTGVSGKYSFYRV